jgi:hypothetical protein
VILEDQQQQQGAVQMFTIPAPVSRPALILSKVESMAIADNV